MAKQTLLLGHSPDPDDAFMFYALAKGLVQSDKWDFQHVLQDIQTLNERALRGELHITAISIHAYPYLKEQYALLNCGASMGDRYGPLVVARQPMTVEDLKGLEILIPGEMTTAFLALNLLLGPGSFRHRVVMFDEILTQVAAGQADAGLIIHEGQLTYRNQDLHKIVDLGEWWHEDTGLPLPLGGNAIRRDLGVRDMREIASILHQSIEFGLSRREEAVAYALGFARDMDRELADRFVGMYVNKWTLDFGDVGRGAVQTLLGRGCEAGLLPACGDLDFIRP
ncbi:MAG: ABC transporter substrate-binding protein [Planctomycetota bacterium]|nr:ABC transporter substrate-binding protein [Planctomycetota bacterium]